jgi:hypothetical protein
MVELAATSPKQAKVRLSIADVMAAASAIAPVTDGQVS